MAVLFSDTGPTSQKGNSAYIAPMPQIGLHTCIEAGGQGMATYDSADSEGVRPNLTGNSNVDLNDKPMHYGAIQQDADSYTHHVYDESKDPDLNLALDLQQELDFPTDAPSKGVPMGINSSRDTPEHEDSEIHHQF